MERLDITRNRRQPSPTLAKAGRLSLTVGRERKDWLINQAAQLTLERGEKVDITTVIRELIDEKMGR